MKQTIRRKSSILVPFAALAGWLVTASAWATVTIKFDQDNIAGTLSYDATAGTVKGTDIVFEFIQGSGGTPQNDGSDRKLSCSTCRLNFEVSVLPDDGSGFMKLNPGGGVNTIALTGTILGNVAGLNPNEPAFNGGINYSGTILSGQFIDRGINTDGLQVAGSQLNFQAGGLDAKVDPLIEYFFGTTDVEFRFFNTDFQGQGASVTKVGGLVQTATGASLDNADLNNFPIPEPGTSLLLLLGMSAIAARRRRI